MSKSQTTDGIFFAPIPGTTTTVLRTKDGVTLEASHWAAIERAEQMARIEQKLDAVLAILQERADV